MFFVLTIRKEQKYNLSSFQCQQQLHETRKVVLFSHFGWFFEIADCLEMEAEMEFFQTQLEASRQLQGTNTDLYAGCNRALYQQRHPFLDGESVSLGKLFRPQNSPNRNIRHSFFRANSHLSIKSMGPSNLIYMCLFYISNLGAQLWWIFLGY